MSKHKDKENIKKRNKRKEAKKRKRKYTNHEVKVLVPANFILLKNYKIVLEFINSVLEKVNLKTRVLIFDMSEIIEIDVAALMYIKVILGILKKQNRLLKLQGIYPNDERMKKFLIKTGIGTEKQDSIFKIREGNDVDRSLIPNIIDELNTENIKISLKSQKALYSILLELMDNTKQHAYTNKNEDDNWYFYLQPQENKIQFVFLDTGLGITKTIRNQNFEFSVNKEKIIKANSFPDSTILKLALTGGFKVSATRENNRNKGLPNIYNRVILEEIKNLKIISHRAVFNFNNNMDLTEALNGTLFYWEVDIDDI